MCMVGYRSGQPIGSSVAARAAPGTCADSDAARALPVSTAGLPCDEWYQALGESPQLLAHLRRHASRPVPPERSASAASRTVWVRAPRHPGLVVWAMQLQRLQAQPTKRGGDQPYWAGDVVQSFVAILSEPIRPWHAHRPCRAHAPCNPNRRCNLQEPR